MYPEEDVYPMLPARPVNGASQWSWAMRLAQPRHFGAGPADIQRYGDRIGSHDHLVGLYHGDYQL